MPGTCSLLQASQSVAQAGPVTEELKPYETQEAEYEELLSLLQRKQTVTVKPGAKKGAFTHVFRLLLLGPWPRHNCG